MPPMIAVTTHINADFDALASLVAAGLLYPGALRILPGQVQPAVRDFVAVHWDLLRLRARKELVIGDDQAALGTFGLRQLEKISGERQWDQPVTSMTRAK